MKKYNHSINFELVLRVRERDNFECKCCGTSLNLSTHHIIPLKQGGKTDERNLVTLCESCHNLAESGQLTYLQYFNGYIKLKNQCKTDKKYSVEIEMYKTDNNNNLIYIGSRFE